MVSINALKMDIKHCCRVCMAKNRAMMDIFEYKTRKIHEEIQFCSGIFINATDKLPKNICVQCVNELTTAYNFKTKCVNSDLAFKSLLIKQEINNSNDDHVDFEVMDYLEVEVPKIEDKNKKLKPSLEVKLEKQCEENISKLQKVDIFNANKNPDVLIKNEALHETFLDKKSPKTINISIKNTNNSENTIETPKKSEIHGNSGLKSNLENHFNSPSLIYPDIPVEIWSNGMKMVIDNSNTDYKQIKKHSMLQSAGTKRKLDSNKKDMNFLSKFKVEIFSTKDMFDSEIVDRITKSTEHKKSTIKKNSENQCSNNSSNAPGIVHLDGSNGQTGRTDGKDGVKMSPDGKKVRKKRDQLKGAVLKDQQNLNLEDMNSLLSKFTVEMISSSDFMPFEPKWRNINNKCSKCDMEFDDRKALAKHRRSAKHLRPEPCTCEICGKMFASASSLSTHHKKHGLPQYYCEVCDYNTYEKIDLTKHINMHTGEFQYTCDYCQKVFTFKNNLRSHIRRIHLKNQEKNILCTTCGKLFANRSCLEKHALIHLQIRSYSCDKCPSTFVHLSNYRRHMKVLHSVLVPLLKPGRRREKDIEIDD